MDLYNPYMVPTLFHRGILIFQGVLAKLNFLTKFPHLEKFIDLMKNPPHQPSNHPPHHAPTHPMNPLTIQECWARWVGGHGHDGQVGVMGGWG